VADDNVVPFKGKKPGPAASRVARARQVAAEQNQARQEAYAQAATNQRDGRLIAAGKVVPARISIAMDIAGLDGHGVDLRCGTYHGNPDGDVDRWEQALAVPSPLQVRLMSEVTGFPIAWFYRPVKPGPTPGTGPVWVCWRDRRGCEAVGPDIITAQGVLLYAGEPRPPVDTLPAPLPGMPVPDGDPPAPKPAAPAQARPARKKKPPVVQPTLPTMMPQRIRDELMATLAARRPPGGGNRS
jgi:hypothetical protein